MRENSETNLKPWPPVVIDLSRLATRFSRLAPNGIDRVDLAFARHFTAVHDISAIVLGVTGPRLVGREAARRIVDAMSRHWHEDDDPELDPAFAALKAKLLGVTYEAPAERRRVSPVSAAREILGLYARGAGSSPAALFPGQAPAVAVPAGAIYINVSQFPVWEPRYFRWLERRRDVKPVFFVHDILPLQFPEFFPAAEFARHKARLDVMARHAAALVVASPSVADGVRAELAARGRSEVPIVAEPLAADATFAREDVTRDDDLGRVPYFVSCGTLEPRKNHLMLLNVWRELGARYGERTPHLVLVGTRGWDCENAVGMISRCPALAGRVHEIDGLTTAGLARLMSNAQAVLQPSFAEGYGLPIREAAATGARVLASSTIATTSDGTFGRDGIEVLDPLDATGWMDAVARMVETGSVTQRENRAAGREVSENDTYFQRLTQALGTALSN